MMETLSWLFDIIYSMMLLLLDWKVFQLFLKPFLKVGSEPLDPISKRFWKFKNWFKNVLRMCWWVTAIFCHKWLESLLFYNRKANCLCLCLFFLGVLTDYMVLKATSYCQITAIVMPKRSPFWDTHQDILNLLTDDNQIKGRDNCAELLVIFPFFIWRGYQS